MNLLKRFLVNFFLIGVIFYLSAEEPLNRTEIFRSNSNGLSLVPIKEKDVKKYKYFLKVFISDNLTQKKVLYKDNKEFKKWEYKYFAQIKNEETYYKDGKIINIVFFDANGHKIKEEEYKNESKIKETQYAYNQEGLVELETVINLLNKQTTTIKYRYDSEYRIKQIEKNYPDGKVVYWESFLSGKGIMSKEYYTLKGEIYTFWYNENGQETNGEIRQTGENETLKVEWNNTYTNKGIREKREETNYVLNKKINSWYNKDGKEIKIEIYIDNALETLEFYDYNKDKKIISYKIIKDLTETETRYDYDANGENDKTYYYENNRLKRFVQKNKDGSRTETLYSKNGVNVILNYDESANLIN